MTDPFANFDQISTPEKKWISVQSELESLDGKKKDIKIELMADGKRERWCFLILTAL